MVHSFRWLEKKCKKVILNSACRSLYNSMRIYRKLSPPIMSQKLRWERSKNHTRNPFSLNIPLNKDMSRRIASILAIPLSSQTPSFSIRENIIPLGCSKRVNYVQDNPSNIDLSFNLNSSYLRSKEDTSNRGQSNHTSSSSFKILAFSMDITKQGWLTSGKLNFVGR